MAMRPFDTSRAGSDDYYRRPAISRAVGGGHDHAENSIQESVERSARVSGVIFSAPHTGLAYLFCILAGAAAGLVLSPSPEGALLGLIVVSAPALVAGPLSAPLANLLGGTLYYKRAAFLAAVGVAIVAGSLVLSLPFRLIWEFPASYALLFGYLSTWSVRHAALFAISDNRHLRTLPVSGLQALVGVPLVATMFGFDADEFLLAVLLPIAFLVPLLFFLHIFDAPLKKNFHVSASELFRYYLDHLTTGTMEGEEVIGRFAEPIRAKFGVVAFRRRSGEVKAAIVVPAIHPGPIGKLGGGDLPAKVAESLPDVGMVLVPHGSATHDYNPASTREVERFGNAVRETLVGMEYASAATVAGQSGETIRVTSQVFGAGAAAPGRDPAAVRGGSLLSYTSWPEPIDDVDYGVGRAAELAARNAGIDEAIFIDCHNSLSPGAGAVFPCTPRADAIETAANGATAAALAGGQREDVRVGVSRDVSSFTRSDGIGDAGVQVLIVDVGASRDGTGPPAQRTAYVLWDGNNMLPDVTGRIHEALADLVDVSQVMTTDNHSVNAVAGSYGPVGSMCDPAKIADISRATVQRAIRDLEPVDAGFAKGVVENFMVFGHQKTVQLTSAINVMTSILVELVVACLVVQGLGVALTFWMVGLL